MKTSTGFNGHGATIEHVRLMAACCEKLAPAAQDAPAVNDGRRKMQVKASGGIRTLEDAGAMLEAGASRLGTSAGVWIARHRIHPRLLNKADFTPCMPLGYVPTILTNQCMLENQRVDITVRSRDPHLVRDAIDCLEDVALFSPSAEFEHASCFGVSA